jgi:alpha-D-ribose 1-methylphosphonate 5-triphosphate synthase subunit PhnH
MQHELVYDEVFDAQWHFRVIMDCMGRPGKIGNLQRDISPPELMNKASDLVGFALLDTNASFCCIGKNKSDVESYLEINTHASKTSVDKADFIFLKGDGDQSNIHEAKIGSLSYPEDGATLVIDVNQLSNQGLNDSLFLRLNGPGVENENELYIKGIAKSLLIAIAEVNQEFPLGVDLILTDRNNNICCIPRSNQFSIE